jgi:SAM-dependent methyltransferase
VQDINRRRRRTTFEQGNEEMSSAADLSRERWKKAQLVESQYWTQVLTDATEFLRILHEKQLCIDLVRRHVPNVLSANSAEPKRVVEIGVGPLGIGLCSLLDPEEAWDSTGVEPQPKRECNLPRIHMATYRAIEEVPLRYVQALGEATGLPSGDFDLAICYNVIDHTPNWAGILNEICRLLKPGGHFLLSVDTLCVLNKLHWAVWQRWARKDAPYIVAHPYRFTAFELGRLLQRHGFEMLWMEKSDHELRKRLVGKARRLSVVGVKQG